MSDKPEQSEKTEQPAPSSRVTLPARKTGLSPAQQKLQAALEKAAQKQSSGKPGPTASNSTFRAKSSFAGKKTAFQRKAT